VLADPGLYQECAPGRENHEALHQVETSRVAVPSTVLKPKAKRNWRKEGRIKSKRKRNRNRKNKSIEEETPPCFPALQGCRSVEGFQISTESRKEPMVLFTGLVTNKPMYLMRLKMENEKESTYPDNITEENQHITQESAPDHRDSPQDCRRQQYGQNFHRH
jgi:hypothetical protein